MVKLLEPQGLMSRNARRSLHAQVLRRFCASYWLPKFLKLRTECAASAQLFCNSLILLIKNLRRGCAASLKSNNRLFAIAVVQPGDIPPIGVSLCTASIAHCTRREI